MQKIEFIQKAKNINEADKYLLFLDNEKYVEMWTKPSILNLDWDRVENWTGGNEKEIIYWK